MFITDAAGLREAAKEYPAFNQAMLGERKDGVRRSAVCVEAPAA